MATTYVSIANLALSRVGVSTPIEALDEDSAEASAANTIYEMQRDIALASARWPFATKRATLAPLDGVTRSGWSYAFAPPADYLLAQSVYPDGRNVQQSAKVPYATEVGDDGESIIILCDEAAPELVYTAQVTVPTMFSPGFVNAYAWMLASELALSLKKDTGLARQCGVVAEQMLQRAAAQHANEGHDTEPESELVTGRG